MSSGHIHNELPFLRWDSQPLLEQVSRDILLGRLRLPQRHDGGPDARFLVWVGDNGIKVFVESVWEGGIWIVSETEGRTLQQLEGTVIWIEELPSLRDKLIIKGGSKRRD